MKYLVLVVLVISSKAFSQMNVKKEAIHKDDLQLFIASTTTEKHQDAFFEAANSGAVEITKYLLSKGVILNAYDTNGSTALIVAVTKGNAEVVKLLLKNGANPNQPQVSGLKATALMYAGYANKKEIIDTLIQAGAEINAVDLNGDPAINWATYYGNLNAMRTLIGHGADLTIKSKHGVAADVAFRLWHADSVAEVLRASSFGTELSKNEKLLVNAVQKSDYKTIDKLIKKGISVDTKDELGTPLIHLVSEQGNLNLLKFLHKRSANLSQLNRVGQSAMAIAARFGHTDIVAYFIENGVGPDLTGNEYALTPLMGASVNGSVEILEQLLVAGARVDRTDVVNQAPALHWALWYRNEDAAIALLESGANLELKSLNGQYNAFDLAEGYQLNRVVNWINEVQNPLLGSWLITKINYIYADTTYTVPMQMASRLVVTPTSYAIMYNPYGTNRKSPEDMSKMTDQEKLYSFQTVVFNSGKYVASDSSFTTTADIAKVAGFEGGIQYYKIEKEDVGISITMFDETYPSGKKPEWYGKLEIKFVLRKELTK